MAAIVRNVTQSRREGENTLASPVVLPSASPIGWTQMEVSERGSLGNRLSPYDTEQRKGKTEKEQGLLWRVMEH